MPPTETRNERLSLADLMMLVAVAGAGLALFRPYLTAFIEKRFHYSSPWFRTIEITYGAWSIVAAGWMILLLVLRYRRPCPHRGRLARRPGHVACCAAAVALVVGGLQELVQLASPRPDIPFSFQTLWIIVSMRVGPTVLGAWLLLALSGRWRADRGWMDRLGRLLGCCWIGWMLLWMLIWMLPEAVRALIPPIWEGMLR